jgi:lipopolysaccharide export LptBFGC system permease protein LptF
VSLGLKPARGGHSERFGVSVALFFLYYSLMRVGETLAQRGKLDAWIAMSIPDLVFTVLAIWLFYRAASDRSDQGKGPGDIIWDLVERYERSRQAA